MLLLKKGGRAVQLTGALFLFLFLPLSLLFVPFCPAKYRKLMLTLLSSAWYVLANLRTPFAIVQIFLVVLLCSLLAALPDGEYSRLRCAAGVVLPVIFFITARLLAEYGPASYPYPYGLTLVTLGAVSMSIDRYRGDAPDRDGPLDVVGYLLFFPTLTMGPILRYKQYLYVTEHTHVDIARFSAGARLYMLGLVKRIAVAAVLLRALEELIALGAPSLSALLLALFMAFCLLFFFVTGCTDMARGLMLIYGFQPPRAQGDALFATTPTRMLYGMTLSLDRYFEDYVSQPLTRRLGKRWGRVLAAAALFLLTVFFYRLRPELLLLAAPLLVIALCTVRRGRFERFPRHALLRALCRLFSVLLVSVFALGLVLEEPLSVFAMLRDAALADTSYSFFQVYNAVSDIRYLTVIGTLFLLILPLEHVWPRLARRCSERTRTHVQVLTAVLIIAAFVVTLLHFMPQFPQYASSAFDKLFL